MSKCFIKSNGCEKLASQRLQVVVTASNGDMYVFKLPFMSLLSRCEQMCDVSSILLSNSKSQMLHFSVYFQIIYLAAIKLERIIAKYKTVID